MRTVIARSVVPSVLLLTGAAFGAALLASRDASSKAPRYRVTNLASLGGTRSLANSVNNAGMVAGYSNLPGDQSRHAVVWLNGTQTDLGTLGGPNSNVAWPVKSNTGMLVGIAQTATPDPLGEAWSCSAFFPAATGTGFTCLGFVWKAGSMRALPTLGGNNGYATGANNRGQVVGWAENDVHDSTCTPPQVLQFRAVVWGPGAQQIRELGPLPGDTSSAATATNDRGQVVGISGTCDQAVGRRTGAHAVLWENGKPTDLGNLGSTTWNTPAAINQRGDVVGFDNTPAGTADAPAFHAFLWTRRDGIRDLGTLPGDATSQASAINEQRQVVGVSCNASNFCRAFLWQNGVMIDLNTLVGPGYTDLLAVAQDINDRGEIVGRTATTPTNERFAFLATPVVRK